MITAECGARGRQRAAVAESRVALMCLLVAAAQWHDVTAAPPAIQNSPSQQLTNIRQIRQHLREVCIVSLQRGVRSGGGQHVTVSAPPDCNCTHAELSVLQRRGIPCGSPPAAGRWCGWMTAHAAATNSSRAEFLVSVGGQFRPLVRCHPPQLAAHSRRPGGMRVATPFFGQPVTLPGIELKSWNVSIAASTRGDDLLVRVRRQTTSGGASDAYFPELYVTLYRPPGVDEYGLRRVDSRRVEFSPSEEGVRLEFVDAAAGGLGGYRVDVRPAGSWVCRGNNDGCQRRYAMVEELLGLTEQARADRPVEA